MEITKQIIKPEQVTRRGAEWRDFELLKSWRNSEQIYQTMVEDARPLSDEEIAEWIGSYIQDKEERYGSLGVIYVGDKPVGWQLARDFESGIPEIGVAIAEQEYLGNKLVDLMDRIGLDRLRQKGFTKIRAKTRKDNSNVLAIMPRLGYKIVYENDIEIIWIRDL